MDKRVHNEANKLPANASAQFHFEGWLVIREGVWGTSLFQSQCHIRRLWEKAVAAPSILSSSLACRPPLDLAFVFADQKEF